MSLNRPWVVMKFGGTSVGDPANWPTIQRAIESSQQDEARPFLVCSALSGISNLLEDLLDSADTGKDPTPDIERFRERHQGFAQGLGVDAGEMIDAECRKLRQLVQPQGEDAEVPPAVRARVMAAGELLSTRIGAEWLRSRGLTVVWKDARRLLHANPPLDGASAHQQYLSATCSYAKDEAVLDSLGANPETVVITQGFIAGDAEDRTVLLGRGGSDTAAAYFASKLAARRLEIWTDVPGIFTANPHDIPQAKLLHTLSYDEAETLAGMGAKVLHPRCIQPVREAEVPLQIRWTARPEVEGTLITPRSEEHDIGVKAVSGRDHLCLIAMERRPGWQPVGFMADVSSCFKRQALSMDLLSSSPSNIQATLDLSSGSGIQEQIPALVQALDEVCNPTVNQDVASVSMVGHGMRACLHRIGPTMQLLREPDVLMLTQAANDLTFSLVVPEEQSDPLLKLLHRELFEDVPLGFPFGPTWSELQAGLGQPGTNGSVGAAQVAIAGR